MSLSNNPAELLKQYRDAIAAHDAACVTQHNAQRDVDTVKVRLAKVILPADANEGVDYSAWIDGTYVSARFSGVSFFVISRSGTKTMLDAEIEQQAIEAERLAEIERQAAAAAAAAAQVQAAPVSDPSMVDPAPVLVEPEPIKQPALAPVDPATFIDNV